MTLYSPSFTSKPRNAVNVEYNIPKRVRKVQLAQQSRCDDEPSSFFSPTPSESVAHSPTPSAVRMAARLAGAVKKCCCRVPLMMLGEKDFRSLKCRDDWR